MYYYAVSDKGSVKEINQDSVLIRKLKTPDNTLCVIGCICDGLGGLSAGEMASCTAVSVYSEWFTNVLPAKADDFDKIKVSFAECSQILNEKIYSFGKNNGFRIGTTVSGILIIGEKYLTFNIGDSRVYLDTSEGFTQLTKDNSFVQQEIDAGRMSEEEAKESGRDHILMRCLGGTELLEAVDFTEGYIHPDDKFMFCSDGARHVVSDEEYHSLFSHVHSKEHLAVKLPQVISEIIKRGETDNISIGVIAI